MGIILEKREHTIIAAEGNINNKSGIIERSIDGHIRAYIRIPDGYQYSSAEWQIQVCRDEVPIEDESYEPIDGDY